MGQTALVASTATEGWGACIFLHLVNFQLCGCMTYAISRLHFGKIFKLQVLILTYFCLSVHSIHSASSYAGT